MRGWKHVPPPLRPRQACTLSSPANLRANLKSISPPARPETLRTYVSTNYSACEVINVLLNYRRVFDDWKSIKHVCGGRGCPSSRIVNPRLGLQRSHFLVSSVNSPCNASLDRSGRLRPKSEILSRHYLDSLAHRDLFDLHLYCVISRLFKGFRVALPLKLMAQLCYFVSSITDTKYEIQ